MRDTSIEYDPFSVESMTDPHPTYRALRECGPMHYLPRYEAWAVSTFEEVWRALGDARSFTIVEGPVFARECLERPFRRGAVPESLAARTFSTWDPPDHTRIRAAMGAPFRPRAVARLESYAREQARACLAELMPRGRFDVAREYASPVSVRVISRVIGLPEEDATQLLPLVNRSSRRDPEHSGLTEDGRAAQMELHRRIAARVGEQRATGTAAGTAMDGLIEIEIGGCRLSDVDVATQLATLLVGGTETMPKIVAGGMRELSLARAQRARLVADPDLTAGAFEEMLRHQGVLQHVGRTALRDLELGGAVVRAGQRLILLLQSANRDEREFPRADRFDIGRRPERHLALGHGPHHCIGAHVARMEGRVLVEELLRAVPEFDVDESGVERPPSEFQIGYTALPIRF